VTLLRDRATAALLVADIVSWIGNNMTWVALPWFVLRGTGSPERMTYVVIAEVVPVAIFGLLGGTIAARIGTRRTLLVCDAARAPLIAAIPALHAAHALPFALLLVLVAAQGVFQIPYQAVQTTVIADTVGDSHADLGRVTAVFQAAQRLTIFVGPSIAGVLIPLVGTAQVLYVDAATFAFSFLAIFAFVRPQRQTAPEEGPGVDDVLAGVKFVARDRLLRVWTPAFMTLEIGWISLQVSMPVLVVRHYHANPHVVGFIFGGFGAGAVAGAVAAYWIVSRAEPLAMMAGAFTCQIAAMWGLAIPGSWLVPATAYTLAGFFVSLVNTPTQALVVLRIPKHLRPQALSVFGTGTSLGAPVALVAIGYALARHDPRHVMIVVLGWQTVSIAVAVAAALGERTSLRAAAVESA
jgi:MFS family permease